MDALYWLLKANIAITLLYGISRLLFQQDTFFQVKRFVLLFSMVFALVYPFIHLTSLLDNQALPFADNPIGITLSTIIISPATEGTAQHITFPDILFFIWIVGTGFFLAKFLFQTASILHKIRQSQPEEHLGFRIRIWDGLKAPFSFFHYIIIDPKQHDEKELYEILRHEETHVQERHTWDVIFSELCCAVCWMNPFAWFLKKDIRINLEFLADRAVISSEVNTEHYQLHLLRLSYHKAIAQLSNNFNVSPLKTRIHMMNKKSTSKMGMVKYAIIAPFVAGLLLVNNLQAQDKTQEKETQSMPDVTVVESGRESVQTQERQETAIDQPKDKQIYEHVEKMPEFPGGTEALMKYLSNNIKYPVEAQNKGIQGVVICRFVINAEGNVTDARVVRSLDPACDKESIRVIEAMPKWVPGQQSGKNVSVYYTLPVRFKLARDDQQPVSTANPVFSAIADNTIIELDGKQISKEELEKIDPSTIHEISMEKDKSPAKIIITSKK